MLRVSPILNIAFYKFIDLTDLPDLRELLREQGERLGLKGSVLLSGEGLNGALAGLDANVREFQSFLGSHPMGQGLVYKESYSEEIPFQKLLIKLKKEIIPLGDSDIKPAQLSGSKISPLELKQWLDENRDFEFLDTRNDYEIQFGTFEKAQSLGLRHFRNFTKKLSALPDDRKLRPLVMFCTGGIRCEKASVAAMKLGFQDVYQLDGGILKYFEECGGSHYRGDCFVFDERVALNSRLEPSAKTTLAVEEGRRDLGPELDLK